VAQVEVVMVNGVIAQLALVEQQTQVVEVVDILVALQQVAPLLDTQAVQESLPFVM